MPRGRARLLSCAVVCLLALGGQLPITEASFNGFTIAPTYAVASRPRSAVFADFNGDGKIDLAVVGPASNSLSVLLGNGDGTFQTALETVLPSDLPTAVVAGHFKSTTSIDLAIAYSGSNNVTVLTGNGDGTFNAPSCTASSALCPAVGTAPLALVAPSLVKGSAYQDLAVANAGSNSITLLENKRDGSGGFKAVTCSTSTGSTCTVGSDPVSLVAADFNGDGIIDLAVANAGSNTISLLLGTGKGTGGVFQAALTYGLGTGTDPVSIAAGALDGDSETDLVVANLRGGTINAGNLSVLLNTGNSSNGDPTFTTTNVNAGLYPEAVALADVTGGGALDIAVADALGNQAEVLINSGTGTFSNTEIYIAGGLPDGVLAADVNGDGHIDLAVLNANDADVSILLNNGNGAFSAALPYQAGTTPVSIVTEDFTGDGNLDLASANAVSNDISVALGNGLGHFSAATSFAVASGSGTPLPVFLAAGDLTGKGKIDLVVANQGTNNIGVLLNNSTVGKISFQTVVSYAVGLGPTSIAVGDFNGDGKLDLAVTNGESDSVSVLLGNGDGTFQSAVNYSVGSDPSFVLAADFNGDHKLDLAVANAGSNTIGVLLGNGTGTFQPIVTTNVGETPVSMAVGDFNNDGKADLVVANYNDGDVWLLLGNGNGTFQEPSTFKFATGANPSSVIAADVNGDSNLDAVVANSTGNDVTVLLGTGTGGFSSPINCPAGSGPYAVVTGRFTGPGNPPDLAVANQAGNSMTVLLQPPTLPTSPTCNQSTIGTASRRSRRRE